ncbi:FAD-binding domain-containing protein [Aspergillus sclerotioniger CBS 115572]|uniref:FAD-binding domain-containing protein n=1 Tax=Aspergillus sclerotioniger CBS 115572 TaxID=1450535 RepID=A0A317XEQ0_9EURO|nr:FAD-binding domain-containing protein [Aspergillus sclerotioniger CBS 115572]PWY96282.1 FAD-binding domain-containing protein [Aspergillus sclerotioniger CBS 115572]
MKVSTAAAPLLSILPEANFLVDNTGFCCTALQTTSLRDQVFYPTSAAYNESVNQVFAGNARFSPSCIVQPHSAEDVSIVVSALSQTQCQFAVRSGGHTIWPGAAAIEQGVTIDLSLMNSTTYHEDKGVASILPGARWQSVYKTLEPYGVTVPGGRSGAVGVSGFLIGGGNSFYTAQVGFACDNVENFQVVLASGSIVNANRTSHSDLYQALKGGSINFGIVTKYDIRAFPHETLWGGLVVYDNSTTAQQIEAGVDFTNNIHNDPYASWIGMWGYDSVTGQNIMANALEYTKPVAYAPAFEGFLKIPNITSTMRFASIYDLTNELGQTPGYRYIYTTGTYKNDATVLRKAIDLHNNYIEQAKTHVKSSYWAMDTMIQPWPKLFSQHSVEKGGNVLGLERFDENLIQLLFDYSWDNQDDDDLFRRLGESILGELNEFAKSIGADNEYVYLNYADKSQNPLKGYGEKNIEFISRVAKQYDPDGVFQIQVPGGFKISEV